MNHKHLSNAMEYLDEDLLSSADALRQEADLKQKKTVKHRRAGSLWLRYGTMAAGLLLTIGILAGLGHFQNRTEPMESIEGTSQSPHTPPPSSEIPVWKDRIWDSGNWEVVSYNQQGFIKRGTNRLRMMLNLNAHYGDLALSPEEESLMTLWGEWKTTALNADYEKHFALYPDAVVEHCFTSTILVQGMTYEAALERIYSVSERIWPFTDCVLDYQLLGIVEATQEERDRLTSNLSALGLKSEKVSRVTCMRFSYTARLSFDDYYMEESREEQMLFYCYDGNWYLAPWTVSDGLCFELLANDLETGYLKESFVRIDRVESFVNGVLKPVGKSSLYYIKGYTGESSFPGDSAQVVCYAGYGLTVTDPEGRDYQLYFISKMPR